MNEFVNWIYGRIELPEKTKKVYNILGDYPDVVAKFLVDNMLKNNWIKYISVILYAYIPFIYINLIICNLVTSMEFESMNAAVKGQCVKPLHQLAINGGPEWT